MRGYANLGEIPHDVDKARALLREAGFEHVRILEGGIDAWAKRIDSSMPRY